MFQFLVFMLFFRFLVSFPLSLTLTLSMSLQFMQQIIFASTQSWKLQRDGEMMMMKKKKI